MRRTEALSHPLAERNVESTWWYRHREVFQACLWYYALSNNLIHCCPLLTSRILVAGLLAALTPINETPMGICFSAARIINGSINRHQIYGMCRREHYFFLSMLACYLQLRRCRRLLQFTASDCIVGCFEELREQLTELLEISNLIFGSSHRWLWILFLDQVRRCPTSGGSVAAIEVRVIWTS